MEVQYIMRSEILDEATCDICADLNGITLRADDPAWSGELGTLAHCNCRMMLVPLYTELPTGLETTPQSFIDSVITYMGATMTIEQLDILRQQIRGIERLKAKEITFEDLEDILSPYDLLLRLYGEL